MPDLTAYLCDPAYACCLHSFKNLRPSCLFPEAVAFSEVFFVAIQEYVQSIAATGMVSKEQAFRFLEIQFARADKNHDGLLDFDELALFAQSVSCPETLQR